MPLVSSMCVQVCITEILTVTDLSSPLVLPRVESKVGNPGNSTRFDDLSSCNSFELAIIIGSIQKIYLASEVGI